jgi:L-asparagine transporter-like permease
MKIKSFFLGSLFLTFAIAPIAPVVKKDNGFVKSLKILNIHDTQGPKTLLA